MERRKGSYSQWIFPNPLHPERPTNPSGAYSHLKLLLKRAGLPDIRFHDLRHTFATHALTSGVDVKTLSAIIGHVSSSTTLNIYAHVTDEMRQSAAAKIDRGIAKAEVQNAAGEEKSEPPEFTPYKPPRRRSGTGCVSQINDHLWDGRYSPVWPDCKKHARNVYAKTEAECKEKSKVLIREMKKEIAKTREKAKMGL